MQSYDNNSILKSTLKEDTITITVIATPVNSDQATDHLSSAIDASVKLGPPQEIKQNFSVGSKVKIQFIKPADHPLVKTIDWSIDVILRASDSFLNYDTET